MTTQESPHAAFTDPDSEREFIGGLLRRPEAVEAYLDRLGDTDLFTVRACEDSWVAIMSLASDGADITVPAVRSQILTTTHSFGSQPEIMGWLMSAQQDGPRTLEEIRSSFERVRSARKKRSINAVASSSRTLLLQPGADPDHVLADLAQQIASLESEQQDNPDMVAGDQAIHQTLQEGFALRESGGPAGITTGSADLDRCLGSLVGGRLITFGARPAGGKSVVGLDVARAALRQGHGVLHFSLEMSLSDLMTRMLAAEATIHLDRFRAFDFSADEEERLAVAASSLPWANLRVVDRAGLTAAQILAMSAAQIRRWRAHGIAQAVIVVDYVQLIRHVYPGKTNASLVDEIEQTLNTFKSGAKQLDVPIVLLAQLNRQADDREPRMSDLRSSGGLENASDQVVLLHRPSDAEDARSGEIDFIVAKNRHGESATISRAAQFHYARVMDLAKL